jgi:hypothetical protein
MSAHIAYKLGQLDMALRDPTLDIGQRVFATLYTQDPAYVFGSFKRLRESDSTPALWKQRIALMTCAYALVNDQIKVAFEAFNSIDIKAFGETKDTWSGFYGSTLQFLAKILRSPMLARSRERGKSTVSLIGDSHVMGISGVHDSGVAKYYVPGIVIKGLASPLHNHYKQALINAQANAYSTPHVVHSIGEIDSRGLASSIAKDSHYWDKTRQGWQQAIEAAYAFIAQHRNPLQRYSVIIPPVPSENVVGKEATLDRHLIKAVTDATTEFRTFCQQSAEKLDLGQLEYPQDIQTPDGLNASQHLLDHAHFTLQVYLKMLVKIKEGEWH